MILSGVNFSLYYLAAMRGNFRHLWKDEELRWFLKSVGILTLFITGALFLTDYYDLETSFRKALFQVATAHTSCGFTSDDYNLWPPCTWMLLIFAMISGGCTGSTSGGVKICGCLSLPVTSGISSNRCFTLGLFYRYE